MNFIHTELFNCLTKLCANHKDYSELTRKLKDGTTFKVFVRENSATDGPPKDCLDTALNALGIMFKLDESGQPEALVSLPPQQFFDVKEINQVPTPEHIVALLEKLDGSIIHTYLHKDKIRLKSRTSLDSLQAVMAYELLSKPEHQPFKNFLAQTDKDGITIALEFTSPRNKIVVEYDEPRLTILSMRDRNTLKALTYQEVKAKLQSHHLEQYLVKDVLPEITTNRQTFLDDVASMKNIEGYVALYDDGSLVKYITDDFKEKYNAKQRNLPIKKPPVYTSTDIFKHYLSIRDVELMKDEFRRVPEVLTCLDDIITKVKYFEDHHQEVVDEFYKKYGTLSNKDYAITAKKELHNIYFSMTMAQYKHKRLTPKEIHLIISREASFFGCDRKPLNAASPVDAEKEAMEPVNGNIPAKKKATFKP